MDSRCLCLNMSVVAARVTAAEFPAGVDPDDCLFQFGLLDVTKAPYLTVCPIRRMPKLSFASVTM